MMKRGLIFAVACALVACGPAQKSDAPAAPASAYPEPPGEVARCGDWTDFAPCTQAPELDVGTFPIGAKLSTFPPNAVSHTGACEVAGRLDCTFTARDGFRYTLFKDSIVNKELRVGEGARLPFGLTRAMTPEQAMASTQAHTDAPLQISTLANGEREIGAKGTLKNAREHAFWIHVIFDRAGKLNRISVEGPPVQGE